MKTKLSVLLLILALALTGCSLARPEKPAGGEASGDRFLGVYMVFHEDYDDWSFYNNPHLEELGTEEVDTGAFGSLTFPREVLFGQIDQEGHTVTFPGLEGYALFSYTFYDENGTPCSTAFNDMTSGGAFHVTHSDEGTRCEMEGTLYTLPNTSEDSVQHGVWTALRVLQTQDGRIYLDGHGDSFSGGGFSSITQEASYTSTVNGESTTDSVKVTIHLAESSPLEKLVVTQFGKDNTVVLTETVTAPREGLAYHTLEETEWVLIEEFRESGVERTVITPQRGENAKAQYHAVIQFDRKGSYAAMLEIW